MAEVKEYIVENRSTIEANKILSHIPTEVWVSLQFSPSNPYTKRALMYTGRFNLLRCGLVLQYLVLP